MAAQALPARASTSACAARSSSEGGAGRSGGSEMLSEFVATTELAELSSELVAAAARNAEARQPG